MKILISFFLMALLSFTACLYFPWWSIAVVCFLISIFIPQSHVLSFLTGFFSLFVLWFSLSFYISYQNDHILAHRLSPLFIKNDNPYFLILLTATIGAIIGGFASLAGSFIRRKHHLG